MDHCLKKKKKLKRSILGTVSERVTDSDTHQTLFR